MSKSSSYTCIYIYIHVFCREFHACLSCIQNRHACMSCVPFQSPPMPPPPPVRPRQHQPQTPTLLLLAALSFAACCPGPITYMRRTSRHALRADRSCRAPLRLSRGPACGRVTVKLHLHQGLRRWQSAKVLAVNDNGSAISIGFKRVHAIDSWGVVRECYDVALLPTS